MKAVFLSLLLVLYLAGFSQREYFIFIQSDNEQQFYLQLGDKTFSSSSIGHVIISKLADSIYTLNIGFPKEQYPARQFIVRINKKDRGFQLKNMGQKGWALFNLQTMELLYPVQKETGLSQSGYSLIKKNDEFTRLMSQVVNDTAVLYSLVYDKPPEATVKDQPKQLADTLAQKNVEAIKEPVQVEKKPIVAEIVSLVYQLQSDTGLYLLFKDEKDSVKLFISSATNVKKNQLDERPPAVPDSPVVKRNQVKEETGHPIVAVDSLKQETGKIASKGKEDLPIDKPAIRQGEKDSAQQKKVVLLNSDCKAIAWDNDVDKLRIKMLSEKDPDNKINIARKVFKLKCFRATQIKALSELFITDQEKYKFLDAAYPFVLDTEEFKQLSYLLTDEYYVKRFRTMVRLD